MNTIPAHVGFMSLIGCVILPVYFLIHAALSGRYRTQPIPVLLVFALLVIGVVLTLSGTTGYWPLYSASAYVLLDFAIAIISGRAFRFRTGLGWMLLAACAILSLLYVEAAFILLTQFLDVIYPPLLLFVTAAAIVFYASRRYQKVTLQKGLFVLVVCFLANVFFAKVILEQYIEDVAASKFSRAIDAHLQLNVLSSHPYLSDNHAAIQHAELGLLIWSFKERGFIRYKRRTGW